MRATAFAAEAFEQEAGNFGRNSVLETLGLFVGARPFEANDIMRTGTQAKAFETGVPESRVVRLAHANHYVFLSNEADVLRKMRAFLDSLH